VFGDYMSQDDSAQDSAQDAERQVFPVMLLVVAVVVVMIAARPCPGRAEQDTGERQGDDQFFH
jgi:hypothetical protein